MSIEQVCDFWNRRPCNIKHSSKPIGTREYFEEVRQRKYFVEPHIPTFADFAKWKGKRVLEIGCGIGTATFSFAEAGAYVTAIDLSETSLDVARMGAEALGLDICFKQGDAEHLDEILDSEEKFDLVYSFGVIHHSPSPRKIIEQITKFIAPSGELRIMLYSLVSYKAFQFMHEKDSWNMSKMRETIQYWAEAQSGCPVAYVYSFAEVEELLHPWFKIDKIWKDHIFTWDIDEYKQGRFEKDSAWQKVSDEELHRLERELGWHTLVYAHYEES